MEYMIITEWDGTKVDQAMSVFRKALEELEAEVRSLKAKADETTGKIMKVIPIKYDYNPDITAYTRTGTLYNPSLETIVANARAEAEKKWNAVVSIHEDNKVALENNTALRKKIDLIMENIGIPRTYTTHRYKSTRSRTRMEEKHTAGFIEDQMRNIPVDDGFSAAEAAHQRFMQAIDEYEKKALAEKEKQEKEQQARIRAEELAKALSVLVVKYELPYNSDWDSVLDKLLSMNKYLRLAHYLQKNRGDWSDGPDYAKTGLDGFTIETPQDEEIYNEISGLIVDWDGDGRVFRDATWNYDVLFGMVPAELLGDYQICMRYFGDY